MKLLIFATAMMFMVGCKEKRELPFHIDNGVIAMPEKIYPIDSVWKRDTQTQVAVFSKTNKWFAELNMWGRNGIAVHGGDSAYIIEMLLREINQREKEYLLIVSKAIKMSHQEITLEELMQTNKEIFTKRFER